MKSLSTSAILRILRFEPMTYRRLFICLCLAGLLALAGTWWMSLRYESSLTISSPRGRSSVGCGFFSGSFAIDLDPYDGMSKMFDPIVIPATKDLRLPGGERLGPMGDLDWGKIPAIGGWSPRGHYRYYVVTPLWFLYLAFVAIAYLALRRPMRKQRLLEEQGAGSLREMGMRDEKM